MSNFHSLNNSLRSIDWDFGNLTNEGLNSLHWYPATFVSAIPGSIIPLLSKENDLVIDTFCGTSVTGYEAIRLGRRYIGIDNNPIAVLISKAKLMFPDRDSLLQPFESFINDPFISRSKKNEHPNELILKKWYHSDTYYELNSLLSILTSIESPTIRIPALAVFSSILKKTCSQGKHWGWVCDNVIPKPEEIIYKNAIDIFNKSLNNYCDSVEATLSDIKHRNIDNRRKEIRSKWEVKCADTIQALEKMDFNSIDLIVTSPPYNGVADYVKAQRLSFLWFDKSITEIEGYSYDDFEGLRRRETGARSKRYNQNSYTEFINYMKLYIEISNEKLKKGKYFVLILGDSKARNQTIDFVDEYATSNGFSKEYEFSRQIRESRRRLMAKVKNEQIKVYKKR
jgi:16S rRNA G966 N2-methylase RsmD